MNKQEDNEQTSADKLKAWLKRGYEAEMNIRSLEAQKQKWIELSLRVTPGRMDPNKVQSSNPATSRIENCVTKIDEIERKIDKQIDIQIDAKLEIEEYIESMPDGSSKRIFEYRYLCYWPWQKIANAVYCSKRHAHRIHSDTLKKMSLNVTHGV